MGWANKLIGWTTGNGAEVDTGNQLKTVTNAATVLGSGVRFFSENDPGQATGAPYIASPETDDDYRLRVSTDVMLDEESFVYSAQNFTKHAMYATTFVPSWTSTGFNTNPTALTTASAAMVLKTYKTFSITGTETLSLDAEGAFSAAMVANQTLEFGLGLTANTTPYDVFDGAYIRATNIGVFGVIRNNSATDTIQTSAFNYVNAALWIPVVGRKYQFIVYISSRAVEFWISDPVGDQIWLAAEVPTPAGFGAPIGSPSTSMFVRQVNGGTAPSTAVSFNISRYNIRRGGVIIASSLNEMNARISDSILSAGTLTTTANQTVTTGSIVPAAAAVPTNTTSLLASLSGKVIETLTLAAGTDGILMSYQNPALPVAVGTTYALSKRLRIDGLFIASYVSTVCVNAAALAKGFYIAYGSTSLSLAGVAADTVTTKAYRRVQIPLIQSYPINAAAGTIPSQISTYVQFKNPIFVNAGEFVALVTTNNAAATSGAATHQIAFDYSWE